MTVGEKRIQPQRAFSGVQPSGDLHIGNYLGAIRNWLEIQERYESLFCVVDYHAITTPQDPKTLRQNIWQAAALFLACGIHPERSTLFVQSDVPEHTELTWILDCIATMGELRRMTQFKDKSKGEVESVGVGLFNYPVLMAADILLYQTDVVPVGEDQKQHLELARDLAERFNGRFGKTFVVPTPDIRPQGARIMGLDDPTKKMSKSAASDYHTVRLLDAPDVIRRKLKKAVTDSGREIRYDEQEKPAVANLLTIYSLFSGQSIAELENQYHGASYAPFKEDLAEVIISALTPIQTKMKHFQESRSEVHFILERGAQTASAIAEKTMLEVKKKAGLGRD
ncbi:MAG: tryptophan--tRNA ligase [Deltaproteobacteria bacterium]|nr:tryptophan--tRNA ligase [Deltaproteobacteria bacterium]